MLEPTVARGSNDEYGSWKIICAFRRMRPELAPRRLRDVAAVEAHLAAVGPEQAEHADAPSVDLPDPDSPTSPRVSPGQDLEVDAVDRARVAVDPPQDAPADREVLREAARLDQRSRRAHAAAPPR